MPVKKQERFSPPAVGGISLLVVFAVLCLTVFALLALTTVQADVRLADASAKAVEDYYAADCQAQEILARLRWGEYPEGVEYEYYDSVICRYTVPISETQELRVEIEMQAERPGPDEPCPYRILRWQAGPAGEWESDESLDIWDRPMF